MSEFKQERIANHRVAERLNEMQKEGWEYVEIIERKVAPQNRNGGAAGPGQTVVLLQRCACTRAKRPHLVLVCITLKARPISNLTRRNPMVAHSTSTKWYPTHRQLTDV